MEAGGQVTLGLAWAEDRAGGVCADLFVQPPYFFWGDTEA